MSRSARGVLRGLHYQWPNPQGKLVAVLEGEVWDVAVDIRRGSPTFGQWDACVLSGENQRQFWIPEGFAHGFVVLSESATVLVPVHRAVRPRGRRVACAGTTRASRSTGRCADPSLSDKDARAPFLADVPDERLPPYVP